MGRKKTVNNYFHQGVEDAIQLYNVCTDDRERNRLFSIIYPALSKIAQVWYNKIKPTYVDMDGEEMQMDCLTFLMEKLHMIKIGKGKAFSYLTVTARNYYILANQNAYKKKVKGITLNGMPDDFDAPEVVSNRVEEMEYNGKLFDSFLEYVDENFESMFPHKKQKIFAEPFFKKIKSFKFAEDINRRDMLNELAKEIELERGLVTKHVNRIASFFSAYKQKFENKDIEFRFKEKIDISKEDEEYIKKNYKHYSKRNGLQGISRKLGIKYSVVKEWIKESNIT